jgi:alpha-amylase
MKKLAYFALSGLLLVLLCVPLALAGNQNVPESYFGDSPVAAKPGSGYSNPYALVSRELDPNFKGFTPSPSDWRDRNIYQLFTDRFATDTNNNLAGYRDDWFYRNKCTQWGAIPRNFHQGGNWNGLRQQIGYLQEMGVTAVWISGVQLNEQAVRYGGSKEWRWTPYHQYHVDNFFVCEPASGTFQQLKDLIDDLHAAGIAVILDVAPNHMCDKSGRQGNNGNDDKQYTPNRDGWWWDENNKHPYPFNDLDRFHLNGTINNWNDSPENLWGQFKGTDDLRQEDAETSRLLYMAFKNLIDATDCDGFRVDAIKHIPYDWCQGWANEMRKYAKEHCGKNNFLMFGELFVYDHPSLAGWCNSADKGFNSSLDFPLVLVMNEAFGRGFNLYRLGEEMNALSQYGPSAQNVIAFLDNHDLDRFACTFGGGSRDYAKAVMSPAMTFLYLAPPIPLLYYGTEHCFNQGGHGNGTERYGTDNDNYYNPDDSDWQRECMFNPDATWGGDNGFQPGNAWGNMFDEYYKEKGLYYHIQWLNGLRNKSRALRRGGFAQRACVGGQGLYAFTKWYDDEVALVLINTSDSEYKLEWYDGGWLDVGISDPNGGSIKFYENGNTGAELVCDSWNGRINLNGVTLPGKGSKVLICNPKDNSADVYGEGGGGGGGSSDLWVRNTYGYPTENATLADKIYINTEAGPADKVEDVVIYYAVNPVPGEDWPGTNMVVNAEWDSDGGQWWHLEIPAEELAVGELQYCIRVREKDNLTHEIWDNNGGGNYVLQILPRPADIGATFASVAADPTAPTNGETATITVAMAKTGNDISQLAVKMSYAFESVSGAVGTWTTVSMAKGNTYEDKTYFTASVENLPGGQTLLYKLEATNGGTDKIQANNGNAYRLKVFGDSTGTVGNCWHCPTNHEPPEAFGCMRQPVTPKAGNKVTLWMGNYQGGNGQLPEGQHDPFDMTGGKVWYRFGTNGAWSNWESKELNWGARGGNNNFNNYWNNTNDLITVPADAAGKYLQYFFEASYTNNAELASPTYLYMNPDNSGTSLTTTKFADAKETPFEVGIAANAEGQEPGFIRHAGNLTRVADNKVQIWARIGYQPDNGTAWADEAVIRYRVDLKNEGAKRSSGVKAISSKAARGAKSWKALTNQVSMSIASTENDTSGKGKVMVWVGTIEDDLIADPNSILIYEVYARNTKGSGLWKQAEYNAENGSCTFEYRMWSDGSGDLTVDGVPADYTTSKFFIDETKGETVSVKVEYHAPDDADLVELFTNFGRRDHADDDTDGDGWPDGMIPPAGTNVTAAATYEVDAGYWQAVPMTKGAGAYVKTLTTTNCGVYRITARYGYVKNGVTNWTWYSQNPDPEGSPRRDHVVVISPKKAMEQRMYELNVLTTKAKESTNTDSGNFEDLSERLTATKDDPYGEFSIDYLNRMGINCLWFQPIHPNLGYARGNTYDESGDWDKKYWPGSPYATKNYFSVNYEMTKTKNTEGLTEAQKEANAVAAFTNFVHLCDIAQTGEAVEGAAPSVGTINVMLDGVMNHTSFDAVFGEGIELALAGLSDKAKAELTTSLGAGWDNVTKDDTIPATKLGIQWYSHVVDATHNQADPADWSANYDITNNTIANAPERYDFGKWNDVAELLYGDYSTMVKYDDRIKHEWTDAEGDHVYYELGEETSRIYSEEDQYYYDKMRPATKLLWKYMATYPEYWIKKTGNDGANHWDATDDLGIDGLRCDYAQGLPNQFWEYTINRTRSMKWNFLFMAESLDGGKVGFRSNRQFDILNENMVFRFTQDHVSDPGQLAKELEDRRQAYGNGLILLNETCHDEIIPWGDPQATASRYAMVSAVDGIPMIFYGQEQAISTFVRWWDKDSQSWKGNDGMDPDNPDDADKWKGFQKFESNFGKWIPHFKTWNKMHVWTNPPYTDAIDKNNSRDIAAFYGKINLARLKSPALQSKNRWFCYSDKNTGEYCPKIFFCAKWEEEGKSPNEQDAVFAAVLFLNDFARGDEDGHAGAMCTYDISAFAGKMGIENRADRLYNIKNIASTNDAYIWDEPKSGKELCDDGFFVWLQGSHDNGADLPASQWTENGRVVQYLKVFDVTGEVEPVAPDGLTITDPVETKEVPFGTASYDVVGMAGKDIDGKVAWSNAANSATGSFDPANVWTNTVTLAEGTNVVTFTATSKTGGGSAVVASDDASQSAYADGWAAGDNGGSGFSAWAFDGFVQGYAGTFIATSGDNPSIGHPAFGLYANTENTIHAIRPFAKAMEAGQTIQLAFENNSVDSGKSVGFALENASGKVLWEFYFPGGQSNYKYGYGEGTVSDIGFTDAGLDIAFKLTSATAYSATITPRGGAAKTYTGTLANPEGGQAVARIRFWNNAAGADSGCNFYVNSLSISGEGEEEETTVSATATIVVLPDAHADDVIAEITAVPQVSYDPATGKISVTLEVEGDGVEALTTVTVWTADTLLENGNWNWAPETAQIVDGELQFTKKMPADKPLLISVGKPAGLDEE